MADIIKIRRSAVAASLPTTLAPRVGEPVYDFLNGKLYVGEGESTPISSLGERYFVRWDKLSVTDAKIAKDAVTEEKIHSGAVTTDKIGDLQVTGAKLANNAITTDKIQNGTITIYDLNCSRGSATTIDAYVDQRAKSAAGSGVNVEGAKALVTNTTPSIKITAGNSTTPVYFNTGVPVQCAARAGGTGITLNGDSKVGSTASFYAPTTSGSSNRILKSNGSNAAPTWFDATTSSNTIKWYSAKNADNATVATKADQLKIGSDYYTATFSSGVLRFAKV